MVTHTGYLGSATLRITPDQMSNKKRYWQRRWEVTPINNIVSSKVEQPETLKVLLGHFNQIIVARLILPTSDSYLN